MKNILLILVSLFTFSACQEKIDLKLKSSDSKIVIEAKYSSLDKGISVFISKSATYFGNDTIHGVKNANILLTIGDTTVQLQSIQDGAYIASLSDKYLFKTYKLSVLSEGKNYEATSIMPHVVKIDSVRIKEATGIMSRAGNGSGGNKDTTTQYTVNVYFKDPIGANYYKIILYKNGVQLTDDPYSEEQVFDDSYFNSNITINMPLSIKSMGKEVITVEMMSIDKASYDYYVSLLTTMSAAGGSFSVPENPLSNFNNDALGFFSAYGSDTVSAIVPMPKVK